MRSGPPPAPPPWTTRFVSSSYEMPPPGSRTGVAPASEIRVAHWQSRHAGTAAGSSPERTFSTACPFALEG